MRRIVLPLPFALRHVNVYLVEGAHGWTLVDSGLHTPDGERALRDGLADAGVAMSDVRLAFVTHLHPDHIGMAGTLERAGARVVMHRPEAERARQMWMSDHGLVDETYAWFARHGMPADRDEEMRAAWIETSKRVDPIARLETVEDRAALDAGGRTLQVAWTPGHTDFHAVLVDGEARLLLAGDHVLPRITSNVGLYSYSRDDPLGDFLASLRRVRDLPVTRVLPAHGEPFDDLAGRVDELLAHHDRRLAATHEAIGAGRDAYAICRQLFPKVRSAHDERFALAETLAHLRHLERSGRAHVTDQTPARWIAT